MQTTSSNIAKVAPYVNPLMLSAGASWRYRAQE